MIEGIFFIILFLVASYYLITALIAFTKFWKTKEQNYSRVGKTRLSVLIAIFFLLAFYFGYIEFQNIRLEEQYEGAYIEKHDSTTMDLHPKNKVVFSNPKLFQINEGKWEIHGSELKVIIYDKEYNEKGWLNTNSENRRNLINLDKKIVFIKTNK